MLGIRGSGLGIRDSGFGARPSPLSPLPYPLFPYPLSPIPLSPIPYPLSPRPSAALSGPCPNMKFYHAGRAIIAAPRPPAWVNPWSRMSRAVGRNVVRKGRSGKGCRHSALRRRPDAARPALRADDPLGHPLRRDRRPSPRLRHLRVHHRRRTRHPRPERGVAHHRRPAVPGGRPGPPCRGANSAPRPRGPGTSARRGGRDRVPARHARLRRRAVRPRLQARHHRQGALDEGFPPRGRRDRRRIPDGAPGTPLHRAQRRAGHPGGRGLTS